MMPVAPHHPFDRPLAAARRYKWLMLIVVVLATALGIAGTRFITPEYEVRATIWIESATPQGSGRVGPIRSGELLTSSAWIELFRSYKIVDNVVRRLALYLRPESGADAPLFAGFALADRFVPGKYELHIDEAAKTWALRGAGGAIVERGPATDSIGRKVGFKWQVPAAVLARASNKKVRFTVMTPRETSVQLLTRLQHRMAPGSNFLWLTYHDPSSRLAALTLNTWVSEYIRVAADLKKRNVVEFANILDDQVRFAEKETQAAEAAYQGFRVSTIILPTEGGPVAAGVDATRDPALTSFFDQKIQYDNLRHDREAMEKSIASASTGSAPYEALLLIPSVAESPAAEALREAFRSLYQTQARLRAERQNFKDEHPTVKELLAGLDVLQSQTIPQLANQLLMQLGEREIDYQRRIQGASKELQKIPPRTIEEMRLKRAVVVAEGLYTNLKNRYAEAKLAEASATPDVSVLDTAIAPLSPTKSTAGMMVLVAFVGGLGAAIGLALLLDALDDRIRYSDQATSDLGLVIAGAVPRIPKGGIRSDSPERAVQFVESFRTLRMHVMQSAPGPRITLAVTSAAPGDGKSLVSANLALSFAEAGLRTVLVDGDTRRGLLHRTFEIKASGGLTEYLARADGEKPDVRGTSHANLFFMSCGRRHPRSPELLASPRLKQLVAQLNEQFDVVIFDTPPLAAGIDAYAISAATGSILLVLRMGQTERRLLSAKLSVLDRLPVGILGAVLNGVHLSGEFQYYAYSPDYGIRAEAPTRELVSIASK